MEAIIINGKINNKEKSDILTKIQNSNEVKLYSNFEISEELSEFSSGKMELSDEEKKAINFSVFEKVIQFGEIKINGSAITDLFMIEQASLWHYHKFRIYFFLRNLFYEIELLEKALEKYQSVDYYTQSDHLSEYFSDTNNINVYPINTNTKNQKINFKTLTNYSIFLLLRVLFSSLHWKRFRNKKHLFIDHAKKQACLNLKTLKPEPSNYNLKYLLDKTDDDFLIIDDIEIPKLSTFEQNFLHKNNFIKQKNRIYGECILVKGILSLKVRKAMNSSSKYLSDTYNQIGEELDCKDDQLIFRFFKTLDNTSKLFLFKYFAYKNIFRKYSFKTISSIDENSARIKTILDAAKYFSVKTIGIQHGTIHKLHPAYIYTKSDILRNILAEKTIVWGDKWKDFLFSQGNYNKESLFVAGQIRTDLIPRLTETNTNNPFRSEKNESILVFASQPQRDPILRERAAIDVCLAASNITNCKLIIKLHPAEKDDFEYYHSAARKAKCSNYQIILDYDLYSLISYSDIVITCFSTVGSETVYFNKPLIILDHLKQDIQNYHQEGVAFQATTSEELELHIKNILSGKQKINLDLYQQYISNNAYKVDGNVSERIMQFIKNL